ncbi:hypothetical protein [Streptomyces cacaoi]|uniref:hypothetical protein n=1 Tax=Streptomyces cacaoi TaxID=1898 RepID=UPI00374A152A
MTNTRPIAPPFPAGPSTGQPARPAWRIRPFDGLEGVLPGGNPGDAHDGVPEAVPDRAPADAADRVPGDGPADVAGGVHLGAHRRTLADRLTAALGTQLGERRTFRKAAWSTGLCDQYPEAGLTLFHDDRERLVHIEAFAPAPVAYRGIPLLERPFGDVVDELTAAGCPLTTDDTGCLAPDAGFHLTGDPDEPAQPAESVSLLTRSALDAPLPRMTDGPRSAGTDSHRIVPHRGTDTVRLGEDRSALRARLGPALQSTPEYGGAAQDWYYEHGLVLTFDADDRLTTLVVSYVGRRGTALLDGIPLLDRPYEDVAADLAAAGIPLTARELAADLPDHGVTLHLVARTNPAPPVAAVVLRAEGTPPAPAHP